MFLPNTGIGQGQHTIQLWGEHMAALHRLRAMPTQGHGFGNSEGSAWDIISSQQPTTQSVITYYAHPDAGDIQSGSPVAISSEMYKGPDSFYPGCNPPIPQEQMTIENARAAVSRGGACIGWPNKSSTTGDPCDQYNFGSLDQCAISLTTTKGGEIGYAYISNRCAAYVMNTGNVLEDVAGYASTPTSDQMSAASNLSPYISGALVRRYCGYWKILSSEPVVDSDGEDLGISLCLLERQAQKYQWLRVFINGIGDSSLSVIKSYKWYRPGAVSGEPNSGNTVEAINLVEKANRAEDGEYVSDQLYDNLEGWEMLENRGWISLKLEYADIASNNFPAGYQATFSRASQFFGDCL